MENGVCKNSTPAVDSAHILCCMTTVAGEEALIVLGSYPAWCVCFSDGAPLLLSAAPHQKTAIRAAREYYGVPWKTLKGRGMRCARVRVVVAEQEG